MEELFSIAPASLPSGSTISSLSVTGTFISPELIRFVLISISAEVSETTGVVTYTPHVPICNESTRVSQVCLYMPDPEYQRAFLPSFFTCTATTLGCPAELRYGEIS